jgi:hypothetical protein
MMAFSLDDGNVPAPSALNDTIKGLSVYRSAETEARVCAYMAKNSPLPDVLGNLVYTYLRPLDMILWTTTPTATALASGSATPAGAVNVGTYTPMYRAVKSKQGDKYEVRLPAEYAGISNVLSMSTDAGSFDCELKVAPNSLEHICDFIAHHEGVDIAMPVAPLRTATMAQLCKDPWDADFIDTLVGQSQQFLYDLILAANYLNIQGLMHLGCAKIAAQIKGKPLGDIRGILDPRTALAPAAPAAASDAVN